MPRRLEHCTLFFFRTRCIIGYILMPHVHRYKEAYRYRMSGWTYSSPSATSTCVWIRRSTLHAMRCSKSPSGRCWTEKSLPPQLQSRTSDALTFRLGVCMCHVDCIVPISVACYPEAMHYWLVQKLSMLVRRMHVVLASYRLLIFSSPSCRWCCVM